MLHRDDEKRAYVLSAAFGRCYVAAYIRVWRDSVEKCNDVGYPILNETDMLKTTDASGVLRCAAFVSLFARHAIAYIFDVIFLSL